jgi:hypothetical protein
MKSLIVAAVAAAATMANAQTQRQDYPSCDIAAQHALQGDIGGTIRDAGQAHISVRANILQADLSTARIAGRITAAQSTRLYNRVQSLRLSTDRYVARHGALSPTMRARVDRQLDAVAARICRG